MLQQSKETGEPYTEHFYIGYANMVVQELRGPHEKKVGLELPVKVQDLKVMLTIQL